MSRGDKCTSRSGPVGTPAHMSLLPRLLFLNLGFLLATLLCWLLPACPVSPPPPGTAEPALEIWHLGGSSNNPPRVCCFPALTPCGPKQGCVTNTGETAELSSLLRALPVLICKRLEMQEKVLAVGAVTYWVYPVLNPCLHENCLSSNHPPHVSSAS